MGTSSSSQGAVEKCWGDIVERVPNGDDEVTGVDLSRAEAQQIVQRLHQWGSNADRFHPGLKHSYFRQGMEPGTFHFRWDYPSKANVK